MNITILIRIVQSVHVILKGMGHRKVKKTGKKKKKL